MLDTNQKGLARSLETTFRPKFSGIQKGRSSPAHHLLPVGPPGKTTGVDVLEDRIQADFKSLGCPFAKRYPTGVPHACHAGWSSMARLKEHLQRRHRRPAHCNRCQQNFKTNDEVMEHQRCLHQCEIQSKPSYPSNLWFDERLAVSLKGRSKKGEDPIRTWKRIYSDIFRDVAPRDIPSPFCEHLSIPRSFRTVIINEFAQALSDELDRFANVTGHDPKLSDVKNTIENIRRSHLQGQDSTSSDTRRCSVSNDGDSVDGSEVDTGYSAARSPLSEEITSHDLGFCNTTLPPEHLFLGLRPSIDNFDSASQTPAIRQKSYTETSSYPATTANFSWVTHRYDPSLSKPYYELSGLSGGGGFYDIPANEQELDCQQPPLPAWCGNAQGLYSQSI